MWKLSSRIPQTRFPQYAHVRQLCGHTEKGYLMYAILLDRKRSIPSNKSLLIAESPGKQSRQCLLDAPFSMLHSFRVALKISFFIMMLDSFGDLRCMEEKRLRKPTQPHCLERLTAHTRSNPCVEITTSYVDAHYFRTQTLSSLRTLHSTSPPSTTYASMLVGGLSSTEMCNWCDMAL